SRFRHSRLPARECPGTEIGNSAPSFLRSPTYAMESAGDAAALALGPAGPGDDPLGRALLLGRRPREGRAQAPGRPGRSDGRAGCPEGGRLRPGVLFVGMPDLERL